MNWKQFALVAAAVAVAGCAVKQSGKDGKCCGDEASDEVVVKMAELPAAVQATLTAQSAGGTIGEIARETDDGVTFYEADVTRDGKLWDVKIAADGKLISTKPDGGEDDDDHDKK